MSTSRFAITLLLLLFITPIVSASPDHHRNNYRHGYNGHHHSGYAKVIFVKPVYKTIRVYEPQLACVNHRYNRATVVYQGSPDQIIAGGLIGGIVGHELGNDENRGITTLAGVLIGSAIARDRSAINYETRKYDPNNHTNCEKQMRVIEKQKLVGYKVRYKYRGRIYTTRTRQHPGERFLIQRNAGPSKHFM